MYGYIYETTNLINGMKYIGLHTASKFEGTNYLGSGTKLIEAVKKYGRKNFSVRMLQSCNSFEELEACEIYYIEKYNAIQDTNYYNIAPGGHAGGGQVIPSLEARKKMSISAKKRGNCLTAEGKIRCRHVGTDNGFYQKSHSEETKKHLSVVHKGRIWINNGQKNLHVKPEDLQKYLNMGYCKGMKPKRHDTSGRI